MLSLVEEAEILSEFGLTRNQAKVYLAAVRLRMASVSQISKASKVRREDVYRILPKLEKMGLVEKLLGTPIKIRASPVKEALSILIKYEEDAARTRVDALKAKTATFLKHHARSRIEVEEKTHFALLSARESIMGKMLIMLGNAEREFDMVCSRKKIMQIIFTFNEKIKELVKKGVKVRIISNLSDHEDSLPRIIEEYISPGNSIDLRYTDLPISHFMLVDFKETLIATTAEGNLGDHPCLWTDNESLVGVIQRSYENLWHNSIDWKIIEKISIPEKIVSFMESLRPTNHLIFVYDSSEAKYNVLFNYLKVGLENGEAGVYVASDENPSQIREAMKRFGINVTKHELTGALRILGYEEIYLIDGKFSLTNTLNLWNKLHNESLKKGFKGLRITGETACFFKHSLVRELVEYEKTLHRDLNVPMIAICAYNAAMLNKTNDPINLYTELVRAHGTVLFTEIDDKLGRIEIRMRE